MTNKYRELGDFEINVAVINALYPDNRYQFNNYPSGSTVCAWTGDGSGGQEYFNYCDDYQDAFKLMIDNGISLIIHNDKYDACYKFSYFKPIRSVNKNPCRAIAECFLLMEDEERDNETKTN